MKKIKFLILFFAITATGAYAQEITSQNVSKFKEGTQLSQPDIAFLSMVSNAKVATTRGAVNKNAVKVKTTEFTVGQTLSKEDAVKINSAVKAFTKTNKGVKKTTPLAKSRGDSPLCCQWYYYCDYYGNCRYYKYCWYCY